MILLKKNPTASDNNALNLTEGMGLCCGDSQCFLARKYAVTIDVTSVTAVSSIRIGGQTVALSGSIATNTTAGRALLKAEILAAINSIGYQAKGGIELSLSGNNLTITTDFGTLVFAGLNSSGNAFEVVDAKPYNDVVNCVCCDAEVLQSLSLNQVYSAAPHSGSSGDIIVLRNSNDKVLATWISDGSADETQFSATGAAAVALDAAGLDWFYNLTTDEVEITNPPCTLKDFRRTNNTPAVLDTFDRIADDLINFEIKACGVITNIVVNDGSELYDGDFAPLDSCLNTNVSILGNTVSINTTNAGYSTEKTFTLTLTLQGCASTVALTSVYDFS